MQVLYDVMRKRMTVMSAFKAYIEGYEACLRRFYESKDWKLITREISEPRSPTAKMLNFIMHG